MGVLRLISSFAETEEGVLLASTPVIVGERYTTLSELLGVSEKQDQPVQISKRIRRLLSALPKTERTRVLQFEFPRSSLVAKVLHPKQIHLAISEHSRGGVDVERRTTSERRLKRIEATIMTRLSHGIADEIIWPSRAAADEFTKHHKWAARHRPKHRIVHNGVFAPHESKPSHESRAKLRLAIVASSAPEKNVTELLAMINAASEGLREKPEVCWVGGESAVDQELANIDLRLLGVQPLPVVHTLLSASDALITFPVNTIFDLSILEAMARGVPVIARRLPGFVEALGENYPFYVDSADSIRECLHALSDERRISTIGDSLAHRFHNRFTVRQMAHKYLSLQE